MPSFTIFCSHCRQFQTALFPFYSSKIRASFAQSSSHSSASNAVTRSWSLTKLLPPCNNHKPCSPKTAARHKPGKLADTSSSQSKEDTRLTCPPSSLPPLQLPGSSELGATAAMPSDGAAPRAFHRFLDLPLELRIAIWKFNLPHRVHTFPAQSRSSTSSRNAGHRSRSMESRLPSRPSSPTSALRLAMWPFPMAR